MLRKILAFGLITLMFWMLLARVHLAKIRLPKGNGMLFAVGTPLIGVSERSKSMTNYDVLKKLGLHLAPAGITKLMANADIICGTETPEGNRCGIHNGMCDECVPAWLKEEASVNMLQLLDKE